MVVRVEPGDEKRLARAQASAPLRQGRRRIFRLRGLADIGQRLQAQRSFRA